MQIRDGRRRVITLSPMKRPQVNLLIDTLALASFFLLAATGVLMHFVLPPGSGRISTMLGLNRHEWGGLHFWAAVVLFAILSVHLILHWRWILAMVKGREQEGSGMRVALAFVAVLMLLALLISPFFLPVEQTTRGSENGRLEGRPGAGREPGSRHDR